jgi:outer membrane scaffolding protein for murein synthesis (MipA/OmpV family)
MADMKKQGLILIASLLLSAPVFAQDSDTLITPTSGWLVGPALVSESADGTTPCLMANSFSNNFEIRFSGGGENILAMAVNVHRPTFEAGQGEN